MCFDTPEDDPSPSAPGAEEGGDREYLPRRERWERSYGQALWRLGHGGPGPFRKCEETS